MLQPKTFIWITFIFVLSGHVKGERGGGIGGMWKIKMEGREKTVATMVKKVGFGKEKGY